MMSRLVRRLRSDERGAAIIELAIVAPVFALMSVGVVDLSNAFSRKLALEQGAQRAIEKIMQTTGESTVEDTLAHEAICQVNGVAADGVSCNAGPITASNVEVKLHQECTDSSGTTNYDVVVTTDADTTTFDDHACATETMAEAKYIQVTVTDKYTPMFPIHFAGISSDGAYHLSATAGMRTK
jgi:Flp pilus assembly protein TadG